MKKDFDQNVLELEQLITELEDSSLPLSQGLELFNKGIDLSKKCISVLDEGKGKLNILIDQVNNITKPFDGAEELS